MTSYVDEKGEWESRKISIFGALASFINQLSIGEDLTKISIPSVLLFPYSALELGASRTLGFIDILLRANRVEDPLQRFLEVCKWFLAFTQKEKLGKKPYNPILAETHLSWVDHAGTDLKGITKFFGEQVCHHPPVTAFIIENVDEELKMISNVTFGTHFHGNSVTAQTIGPTFIDFKKHGECYYFPKGMPDMGIKNVVLGTRRHSWEGEVVIICEKSGYKAVLNYYENGWWCVNSVIGYVTKIESPETKLFTIEGPLNQEVTIKNENTNEIESFKMENLKRLTLKYLPFKNLDETSSLRVWRELSDSIVANDMLKADIAKKQVEDSQRKRRNEDRNFPIRFFKFDEEKKFWTFIEEKNSFINEKIETSYASSISTEDKDIENLRSLKLN
jgi:hypothetical protein